MTKDTKEKKVTRFGNPVEEMLVCAVREEAVLTVVEMLTHFTLEPGAIDWPGAALRARHVRVAGWSDLHLVCPAVPALLLRKVVIEKSRAAFSNALTCLKCEISALSSENRILINGLKSTQVFIGFENAAPELYGMLSNLIIRL